jgi:hypothetical protein
MKKHNGHSNGHGHVSSPPSPVPPGYLQATLATEPEPLRAEGRPLIGHAPRHWQSALAEPRSRHGMPSTHSVSQAKAWMPATPGTSSRILLQPTVLKSVPIGDEGEQGIGLHVREGGVMVQVEPWSPMSVGDVLDLFWGAPEPDSPDYPGTPAATKTLQFPDELNKPVLLSVPEDDVIMGWFNVLCRVTRATTGFQEWSPLLRVLVKLDRPGGIDPAPDVNPNLAAPILPPEVIRDGVDTSWAARGVPVTILPYPNMALGDRIRLNWGGVFVEYTLRDSNEVHEPVTLTVNEATLRAAGDGDALVLRYQVDDVVHNRSGWSPSTEVLVNVQGNALFLPEVTNADDNGVIDLALLGSDDVRVLVTAFEPDFTVGDTVTLSWLGHTAEGVLVPYEDAQQVTRGPVQTLEFFVPNANVVALAQGDAVVSYRLQNGRSSKQVRVTIVGEAASLPPPTVDEAPNDDDELDASLPRATVRIPPYPPMNTGDVVTLVWSGTRADGQPHLYTVERQISGSAVGKEIVLQIPAAEIALLAGGTVALWYEVIIGDGTPLRPSQVRTLRVSSGHDMFLPPPSVDEAPDNVTLDPSAVDLYATVRIARYTGMAIDDRVDMYWIGSGAGGSFTDWTTIRKATLDKPVPFDVDKAYVDANDGGTVTVRYTVTPKGGSPKSSSSLTLRVGAAQEIVPEITSVTDSEGDVPDGGTTQDTTVTLSGTAVADMTVELFDNDTISHGVAKVNGARVWTRPVTGLADGSHRFTAKGLYGSEPVSPARSFTVAAEVGLARPIVPEADPFTDTLNLVKSIPNTAVHVVIDYDDMALGDVVTMTWQGTAGAGSNTQTTRVTKLGAISFLISSAAITPNYNRTVQISYAVQRAGLPPDAPAAESLVRNLAIENLPLQTPVSFFVGGTTYYYCRSSSDTIIVPADLPVGDVIYTTPYVNPYTRASLNNVSVVPSHILINSLGSQPRHDATLFQTKIPGVGFRLLFIDANGIGSAKPAGPVLGNAMVLDNYGTQAAIQFVKTGQITWGVMGGSVIANWYVGSNRLLFMGWYLTNTSLRFLSQ